MADDDTVPIKGPINDPVDDGDSTAPVKGPPDDEPIEANEESSDNALEDERTSRDPNETVLKTQPKLPQDYDTPAAPQDDPLTRDLPPGHPAEDTDMDPTDVYESDETDASGYWDRHESNDREDDALYGDNGPDL